MISHVLSEKQYKNFCVAICSRDKSNVLTQVSEDVSVYVKDQMSDEEDPLTLFFVRYAPKFPIPQPYTISALNKLIIYKGVQRDHPLSNLFREIIFKIPPINGDNGFLVKSVDEEHYLPTNKLQASKLLSNLAQNFGAGDRKKSFSIPFETKKMMSYVCIWMYYLNNNQVLQFLSNEFQALPKEQLIALYHISQHLGINQLTDTCEKIATFPLPRNPIKGLLESLIRFDTDEQIAINTLDEQTHIPITAAAELELIDTMMNDAKEKRAINLPIIHSKGTINFIFSWAIKEKKYSDVETVQNELNDEFSRFRICQKIIIWQLSAYLGFKSLQEYSSTQILKELNNNPTEFALSYQELDMQAVDKHYILTPIYEILIKAAFGINDVSLKIQYLKAAYACCRNRDIGKKLADLLYEQKRYKEAIPFLLLECNAHNYFLVGLCYKNSSETAQALKYFHESNRLRHSDAPLELGNYFLTIERVKAKRFFLIAARRNNLEAMYILAVNFEEGQKKIEGLRILAQNEHKPSQFYLGYFLLEKGEQEEALKWLEPFNNIVSKFKAAQNLLLKEENFNNVYEAVKKCNEAASLGHPLALNFLKENLKNKSHTILYSVGITLFNEIKANNLCLEIAAEKNNPEALHKIGCIHYYGISTTVNARLAYTFFLRAANLGNSNAQFAVGSCHYNGKGVDKIDQTEGMEWFKKAANQGHLQSKRNVKIGLSSHNTI